MIEINSASSKQVSAKISDSVMNGSDFKIMQKIRLWVDDSVYYLCFNRIYEPLDAQMWNEVTWLIGTHIDR